MSILQRFSLTGRRALVTGASRGIGRAIAEALADAGADVALVARDQAALGEASARIEAAGRRATAVAADLADRPFDAAAVVAQAERGIGPIDLLVHAAGATQRVASEQVELADYERIMQTNATAGMQLGQAVGRGLLARGQGGSMVFVGSLSCQLARATVLAYTMSKMALYGLVRTLAVEWGGRGVRVNGIAPGYIRTELTRPLQEDRGFNEWVVGRTPAGRWGEPADLAAAAVFLASEAAGFVNGQMLFVDGGWTAAI